MIDNDIEAPPITLSKTQTPSSLSRYIAKDLCERMCIPSHAEHIAAYRGT